MSLLSTSAIPHHGCVLLKWCEVCRVETNDLIMMPRPRPDRLLAIPTCTYNPWYNKPQYRTVRRSA